MLFAFDRERKAILLVGGDKCEDWKGWYNKNISIADDRFDQHQAKIERARAAKKVVTHGRGSEMMRR